MLFLDLLIIGFVSGLLQLVSHLAVLMYFPKTGRLPRYVMGTLGLLLPPTVWMLKQGHGFEVLALWVCAGFSGAAVLSAYQIGNAITSHQDKIDHYERLKVMIDAKTDEEE